MKLLLLNGPNLNLLGTREPGLYGAETIEGIVAMTRTLAEELGATLDDFQSNSEGDLVTYIGKALGNYDGILINPAAYTHTSIALRDALLAVGLPAVEVHITLPATREDFRHHSLTASACVGVVSGFGTASYLLALRGLIAYISEN